MSDFETEPIDAYSEATELQVMKHEFSTLSDNLNFIPSRKEYVEVIRAIEQAVYGGEAGFYGPYHSVDDVDAIEHVKIHSALITNLDDDTIGYVVAYQERLTQEPHTYNGEDVLYIDDLAILPEHQGSGYGPEILRGMAKLAEKLDMPLLFHAKDKTSWAILSSKPEIAENIGLEMTVIEEDPNYYAEGYGARLVMLKPKLDNK